MRQATLKKRVCANGTTVYFCNVNGKQYGLGSDFEAAKKRFGELLADYEPSNGSPNPTVTSLVDRFLEWCGNAKNCEPSTRDWYTHYLESFKKSIGSRLRIRDLKKHHVTTWLNAKYKHVAANTHNRAVSCAKRALNFALDEDLIDSNPIARYKMKPAEHRELVIDDEQWTELLGLLENKNGHNFDDFRDYLIVAYETGARPQEIRTIEAQWFDRANKCWFFPAKKSKGKKRRRAVYLNDTALAITERLCAKFPEGPIFRQNGQIWDKNKIRCKFRRLKEKLGIPGLCVYTLRHTWATRQLQAGMAAHDVSVYMGHSSMEMLKVYGHTDQSPQILSAKLNRKVG